MAKTILYSNDEDLAKVESLLELHEPLWREAFTRSEMIMRYLLDMYNKEMSV